MILCANSSAFIKILLTFSYALLYNEGKAKKRSYRILERGSRKLERGTKMNFEHLINTNFSKLSEADKEICIYINHHIEEIPYFTLKELADKTYTSRSSMIRLLKKLGFTGFVDFKYSLMQPSYDVDNMQNELILLLDSLDLSQILQSTQELNLLLEKTSDIFLFSTGRDQTIQAENFANFLLKRGTIATSVPLNLNSELTKNVLDHLKKDSLLVIFSHKGENDILKTYFTPFIDSSIPIISFTAFSQGWIQSISTINFSLNLTDKKNNQNIYTSGLMHLLINIVAKNLN